MCALPKEAFLSFSSFDAAFAGELVAILRRHGVPVWYSPTDLIGAQQWHDEIGDALRRCDWFLIVLSPNSLQSHWVKRELYFALNDARYVGRIVPLLLQPCDYPLFSWTLPGMQLIDFVRDLETGYIELLRIWGIGYRPPDA
jgi:hypothetical protein